MCARFTMRAGAQIIADLFGEEPPFDLPPRYNVAPTQPVVGLVETNQGRAVKELRWGLVPSWADDLSIGSKLINARSESASEKSAFKAAFRYRRCLIAADGFYEWGSMPGPRKEEQLSLGFEEESEPAQTEEGPRMPYLIELDGGDPFAFAGLWEKWRNGDEVVESCTILTTDSNEMIRPLHDRMPVILPKDLFDIWLDPDMNDPDKLLPILKAYPASEMRMFPVSKHVNNPRNEDPECATPWQ
jgi:putative SOS response-associated peptidase YedK